MTQRPQTSTQAEMQYRYGRMTTADLILECERLRFALKIAYGQLVQEQLTKAKETIARTLDEEQHQ